METMGVRSCRYDLLFPGHLEQWALHTIFRVVGHKGKGPKDKPSVENQVEDSYRRVYCHYP